MGYIKVRVRHSQMCVYCLRLFPIILNPSSGMWVYKSKVIKIRRTQMITVVDRIMSPKTSTSFIDTWLIDRIMSPKTSIY